jgi:hypothetical protein
VKPEFLRATSAFTATDTRFWFRFHCLLIWPVRSHTIGDDPPTRPPPRCEASKPVLTIASTRVRAPYLRGHGV